MNLTDSYHGLAQLLDYPREREELLRSLDTVAGYLEEKELAAPVLPFEELLQSSTLAELQEDYVTRFDFNPAAAPYLGHHLYGDNQKKGAYLIQVKQEFLRHDFAPEGCELPDHLPVLLGFLAHLAGRGEDAVRRRFIEELVLPGLNRLIETERQRDASPWSPLIEAAGILCNADCQEVATC
ncbi:nitrate reductase molybdenum cofactor assembly chaperone [Geomonas sp. Red32]|uniref:nitrate reductase molybdenum cofactor assembly chaperone n=1 Tax=Geomonas sp. Red32 TaxID=2912856 RepID=UPI00202CBB9B|nr:nitrate reductase molybdenum cofactor assembly chaperone [Geomonas sp. Red32]MCM0082952.1 nitrate reductase molybdenum cofactor assembly chaperone [Geomonas sp. Red32]